MSWWQEEPGARVAAMEVGRLLRRALRRPALTLAFALLGGALLLSWQLRRPPRFAVRADMVVRENALSADRRPLSRADMRGFVENVAFTSGHLQAIIDRHGLYRSESRRSPVLALREMRKDIEVEIFDHTFAHHRQENSAERMARIVITVQGDEPGLTMAVAHDLGNLVAQAELGRHAERARRLARLAHTAAEQVRADLAQASDDLTVLEARLALAEDPEDTAASDRVRRALLQARVALLETRRSGAEQQETLLALTAESEARHAGTRVHLAALQAELGSERDQLDWLKKRALASFAAGLALALLLVGAFNPRLYDADDIARAGGITLGRLSRSPFSRG